MDKRKYILIATIIAIILMIFLWARRMKQKKRERQDQIAVKQLVAVTNAVIEQDRAKAHKAEIVRQVADSIQNATQGEYEIVVEEVEEVKYPKATVLLTRGDKTVRAIIEKHKISLSGERYDIETEQTKSINITATWTEFNQKLHSIYESLK